MFYRVDGLTLLYVIAFGLLLWGVIALVVWNLHLREHIKDSDLASAYPPVVDCEVCGHPDGRHPVCVTCLMKAAGVGPHSMSLNEIIDELENVALDRQTAEWESLMRAVDGG